MPARDATQMETTLGVMKERPDRSLLDIDDSGLFKPLRRVTLEARCVVTVATKKGNRTMAQALQWTQMVVFANSVKHGGRCIAGRAASPSGENSVAIRHWLRPVSEDPGSQGALVPGLDFSTADREYIRPLDIVEVPLLGHRPEPAQPENWLVARRVLWKRAGSLSRAGVLGLIDEDHTLWVAKGHATDRVSEERVGRLKDSLALVRPKQLQFRAGTSMRGQLQVRASFEWRGSHFDISVTDDGFKARWLAAGRPKSLARANDCALCISLGTLFEGARFLLVAGVIEAEPLPG